jgi:hypothetical protein
LILTSGHPYPYQDKLKLIVGDHRLGRRDLRGRRGHQRYDHRPASAAARDGTHRPATTSIQAWTSTGRPTEETTPTALAPTPTDPAGAVGRWDWSPRTSRCMRHTGRLSTRAYYTHNNTATAIAYQPRTLTTHIANSRVNDSRHSWLRIVQNCVDTLNSTDATRRCRTSFSTYAPMTIAGLGAGQAVGRRY